MRIGASQACCNHVLIDLVQLTVPGNIDCVMLEIAVVEHSVLTEQKQVGAKSRQKDLQRADLNPLSVQELDDLWCSPAADREQYGP
ncbi:hypothetical protein D3C81_1947330 [compost metagenome]